MSDHYGSYPQSPDPGQQPGQPGQPGYGAPVGADDVAGTGVRIAGFVLDVVVVAIVGTLVTLPFASTSSGGGEIGFEIGPTGMVVSLVVAALYYIVPTALYGQTLAKKLLGTRVVRMDDGQVPGWGKAAGRQVILALLNIGCYIPQIVNAVLLAQEPLHRGWHDKAVGTRVVTTR
ncbi:putative RDD family membrane protein YckC [Nocardioides marinisabuli]|uniref:Putative RDD family membrane protein YckC n=1 Tax=Nocardioides marinisabuli TaxID=419476 RepID=A0A7Y9EZQ8_9ACTN|nr:RDD family protein [Nocardioides marinisabuli]NYD56972.1 putative RDD family membrane protein YckC [Nocardioides marinisabuli]